MVKIAAVLCWYDEPAEALERCVRSLAHAGIDSLVALEGRWSLMGSGELEDTGEEVVWRTARESGIPARVSATTGTGAPVWQSQVAKRARGMELAAQDAEWILVIDADEWIDSSNLEPVRLALSETDLDVATVTHRMRYSKSGPHRPRALRRLYRAGTTVVEAHNGYRYGDRWLHGDPAYVSVEPALELAEYVSLTEEPNLRTPERDDRSREYRSARDREKVERW